MWHLLEDFLNNKISVYTFLFSVNEKKIKAAVSMFLPRSEVLIYIFIID